MKLSAVSCWLYYSRSILPFNFTHQRCQSLLLYISLIFL